MPGRPFSFFNFKGTPSREEHKAILSVFTTVESVSTRQVRFLQSSVSPYSYCMASDFAVHFPLLAGAYWRWRSSVYSVKGRDRTVAVRCRRGTVQRYLRYIITKLAPVSDFMIVCTRTQMIVKGLLDQSMLIQLLWRRWGWFYAPLVMGSL